MGLFNKVIEDVKQKPYTISVDMSSEFFVPDGDLHGLAKHLLWIDENIPNQERQVNIERKYSDYKGFQHRVHVTWKEQRGGNEVDDES